MPMATKLGRMMTYPEWPLPLKSHDCIIMWSPKITWQAKIIICSLTQSPWLSILPNFDHVKYFSCCIPTTTRLVFTKLGKVVASCKKLQPIKSSNPLNMWSCEVTWQIKNILSPIPQYPWPGHQTWQDGYTQWNVSFHKVTWFFDHVV